MWKSNFGNTRFDHSCRHKLIMKPSNLRHDCRIKIKTQITIPTSTKFHSQTNQRNRDVFHNEMAKIVWRTNIEFFRYRKKLPWESFHADSIQFVFVRWPLGENNDTYFTIDMIGKRYLLFRTAPCSAQFCTRYQLNYYSTSSESFCVLSLWQLVNRRVKI